MVADGVMDKQYHVGRKVNRALKYRLKRRTEEVIRVLHQNFTANIDRISILDIGAADGMMLSNIKDIYPSLSCVGLEYSFELIEINIDKRFELIRGDAQDIPFKNNAFDCVIACALIEHVENPERFLLEVHRILRNNGIIIITTPVPFWDKILSFIGHLDGDHHLITFNLKSLRKLLEKLNYKIKKSDKFMMSPIGFPCELYFEKLIKILHLNFLLGNQILVCQK